MGREDFRSAATAGAMSVLMVATLVAVGSSGLSSSPRSTPDVAPRRPAPGHVAVLHDREFADAWHDAAARAHGEGGVDRAVASEGGQAAAGGGSARPSGGPQADASGRDRPDATGGEIWPYPADASSEPAPPADPLPADRRPASAAPTVAPTPGIRVATEPLDPTQAPTAAASPAEPAVEPRPSEGEAPSSSDDDPLQPPASVERHDNRIPFLSPRRQPTRP